MATPHPSQILALLAWVSVPINVGMIALATQQLDDAQAALHLRGLQLPLPPFEKLLVAVIAEHMLLARKPPSIHGVRWFGRVEFRRPRRHARYGADKVNDGLSDLSEGTEA